METFTPKQRMLNAYRGIFSDRYPVAPEFWSYYPARILNMNMIEFSKIPRWKSLHKLFKMYGCEGWGITGTHSKKADVVTKSSKEIIDDDNYVSTSVTSYKGHDFVAKRMNNTFNPSWVVQRMLPDEEFLPLALDMKFDKNQTVSCDSMNEAYETVGDDFLLEAAIGNPFFDYIADMMGFEKTVMYFMDEDEGVLQEYLDRYIDYQTYMTEIMIKNSKFESYFIGCSYSCNSLAGPQLWRRWDKPFIKAMADLLHKHGKLLHVHFHGRAMETIEDFAEIGIDCVCPFERAPGGDVSNLEDLKHVREGLQNKVCFNGNIHTIETLIRGDVKKTEQEVDEVIEAFKGCPRLVVGSGDQVGYETKEENLIAMIERVKSYRIQS